MEELDTGGGEREQGLGAARCWSRHWLGDRENDMVLTIHHEVEKEVKNLRPVLPESIVKTM